MYLKEGREGWGRYRVVVRRPFVVHEGERRKGKKGNG